MRAPGGSAAAAAGARRASRVVLPRDAVDGSSRSDQKWTARLFVNGVATARGHARPPWAAPGPRTRNVRNTCSTNARRTDDQPRMFGRADRTCAVRPRVLRVGAAPGLRVPQLRRSCPSAAARQRPVEARGRPRIASAGPWKPAATVIRSGHFQCRPSARRLRQRRPFARSPSPDRAAPPALRAPLPACSPPRSNVGWSGHPASIMLEATV